MSSSQSSSSSFILAAANSAKSARISAASSSSFSSSFSSPLCRLFCLLLLATGALHVQANNAKFLLSCRVISGICQGDPRCLDEMSARFPDCYLESPFDLLPAKASEVLLAAQEDGTSSVAIPAQQLLEKRTPALKLMKVLMMKDRIPVGRR